MIKENPRNRQLIEQIKSELITRYDIICNFDPVMPVLGREISQKSFSYSEIT